MLIFHWSSLIVDVVIIFFQVEKLENIKSEKQFDFSYSNIQETLQSTEITENDSEQINGNIESKIDDDIPLLDIEERYVKCVLNYMIIINNLFDSVVVLLIFFVYLNFYFIFLYSMKNSNEYFLSTL